LSNMTILSFAYQVTKIVYKNLKIKIVSSTQITQLVQYDSTVYIATVN